MYIDIRAAQRADRLLVFAALLAGALIAVLVTCLLSQAPLVWTALLLAGLLAVIPALIVEDAQTYWLSLFLFLLLFDVKKTLIDGPWIMAALGIDFAPTSSVLVPEIRLSDFPFLVLVGLWLSRAARTRTPLSFPPQSWLAAAYLGWAALSAIHAPLVYLSSIELLRDVKFFLIYLYAANNIRTRALRQAVAAVLLVGLFVQGATTLARQQLGFGFITAFGRTEINAAHLTIATDTASPLVGAEGGRRSFGTVPSPRGTAQHLILVLPVALMFACGARAWRTRAALVALFCFGMVALYVTFSRAAMAGALGGLIFTLWFAQRRQLISRQILHGLAIGTAVAALALIPILSAYLNSRPDNVKVRAQQYDTAVNMIRSHPILGVGLNNSFAVQKDYAADASSQPLGDPTKAAYTEPIHSQYLALAVETGFIGVTLYVAFFGLIWWAAFRRVVSPNGPLDLLSAAILIGMSSLAIEFLADPCFEDTVHVLLWFAAGVLAYGSRAEPDPLPAG